MSLWAVTHGGRRIQAKGWLVYMPQLPASWNSPRSLELELGLIQSHMTQKPMLRGEVDARALRV